MNLKIEENVGSNRIESNVGGSKNNDYGKIFHMYFE